MSVKELKIYPAYQRQFLARALKVMASKIENANATPMFCDIKRTEPKKGKEVIHIALEMDHSAVKKDDIKTYELYIPSPRVVDKMMDGFRNRPDQYLDFWSRWFDHLEYIREAIEITLIEEG